MKTSTPIILEQSAKSASGDEEVRVSIGIEITEGRPDSTRKKIDTVTNADLEAALAAKQQDSPAGAIEDIREPICVDIRLHEIISLALPRSGGVQQLNRNIDLPSINQPTSPGRPGPIQQEPQTVETIGQEDVRPAVLVDIDPDRAGQVPGRLGGQKVGFIPEAVLALRAGQEPRSRGRSQQEILATITVEIGPGR